MPGCWITRVRPSSAAAAEVYLLIALAPTLPLHSAPPSTENSPVSAATEHQVTSDSGGHILTNIGVWSPDSLWITCDRRRKTEVFDGKRIEQVNVETGETRMLFESKNGACCGVATCNPAGGRVAFIHGPELPTPDWQYAAYHRRGVIVDAAKPGQAINLDARDLVPPFTPGALRGGTHVHTFSGDGAWVGSTYEDHVLANLGDDPAAGHDLNQRNIAVSVPDRAVAVGRDHPRNHDGSMFTTVVSRTVNLPAPGSDEISKAFSDAWVGVDGYLKPDGSRQRKAIAFQGHVVTLFGETISEVLVVDLPDDLTRPGEQPLEGTAATRPAPPRGVVQRRLTFTDERRFPGLQGPRHWLRSTPDGSRIAFLMKDDAGNPQIWTVSPNGGPPKQITRNSQAISSAFSISPDGRRIAYAMDHSIFVTELGTGDTARLTERREDAGPTEYACVFSPDGTMIAYTRPVTGDAGAFDQIFIVTLPKTTDS